MTKDEIIQNYLADSTASFRNYKLMAEKAFTQISDAEFFYKLDTEANSVAIVVKHIAGNLLSRWTEFLNSDGEKPDRRRDSEFEMAEDSRESLLDSWETGWQTLFDSIEPLTTEDFYKTVTIRGESHTIAEAINRQLTHYAYHVGQIVFLAKHFRSGDWVTLSVPKDNSDEFSAYLNKKREEGREKSHPLEAPMDFANKA